MYECKICHKVFEKQRALSGHYSFHGGIKSKKEKVIDKWRISDNIYRCPFCGIEKSKAGIGTHVWKVHGEGKDKNSGFRKGKFNPAWNKGLTKETDERVRKQGKSYSKKYKGRRKNIKLSDEVKEKISKGRIKYLLEHPDKVPYIINHSSKESYPERIFKQALIDSNITGWVQEYRNGLYSYDFAFPDLKIDIEIDGSTHNSEKVKKIDKRRDEWSLNEGWEVIRFSAKEVKENLILCIEKVKTSINN